MWNMEASRRASDCIFLLEGNGQSHIYCNEDINGHMLLSLVYFVVIDRLLTLGKLELICDGGIDAYFSRVLYRLFKKALEKFASKNLHTLVVIPGRYKN